jgi:two-component system sensor histidine kinase PilS (NtrC family)
MGRLNPTAARAELTAILLTRLSVLWILVILNLAIPPDGAALYAVLGIAFTVTIPYALWLRSRVHANRLAPQQFMVDLVMISGLIYLTGELHSGLVLLYPLVILSAGIVSTPPQAARITVLGVLVYLLMAILLLPGMPTAPAASAGTAPAGPMYSTICAHTLLFVAFGAASVYISSRYRYLRRDSRNPGRLLQATLDHLDAAVLMLDREGFILSANPAAGRLLQCSPDQLLQRTFAGLCVTELRSPPEAYGPAAWLERTHAPPVPAAVNRTEATLPDAAVPGLDDRGETAKVTLVVLHDLSPLLELTRWLDQMERTTAATRMASEMAHDIRTPLTTISASVQLLHHYESHPAGSGRHPQDSLSGDRTELFEHILSASEEMNTVIRNFVDFADFSPDDLLSIIKLDSNGENKGYIGHLNTRAKGFKHGQNFNRG